MAKVAVIVGEMFEDSELRVPVERLRERGHQVVVIGLEAGHDLTGKRNETTVRTELAARDADPDDFDALVIPGGYSPDKLRVDRDMVRLTRAMGLANKPVAAVCHAPWMLIEANLVDGRTVTSWPS